MIKTDNNIPTLYVKGNPFLALGGEIHNSNASNLDYLEKHVWPNLKDLHLNTLIVPIYWELIEKEQGKYDFHLLDSLIQQARENQLHLILLWFGLWKNSESTYVPSWMKQDTATYFRAQKVNGESINTISPFCQAAIEKDLQAFARAMAHIKQVDEAESTVIMLQIENEIGLLGTERDYCETANELFHQDVPEMISTAFDVKGSWKQAFDIHAEENFMAYHFAKAIEAVAAAGQTEYPLPCYANAWLRQYPWYPGSYPSGGPVKNVHKIWKLVTPSLFTLAPDIYVPYVADVMEEYSYEGNPLVIPEVRKDAVTASYCLYAFGKHNAICYSPFGIEELALPPEAIDKPPMELMIALNIDPSAFEIAGSKDYLSRTYELIENMKPLYLKYRGTEHLKSYLKKSDTDYGAYFHFSKYDLAVKYNPKATCKPLAAGMVYELSENSFLVVGMMSSLTFRPKAGENLKVHYLRFEEGDIVNGEWKPGRILNGDEQMSLRFGPMPSCYMVELFKY